jgi:tetratricopeptide (TPR) repeat protein
VKASAIASIRLAIQGCESDTTQYRSARVPLDFGDQKRLVAAEGYCALSMFLDADAELEKIDPYCRSLPEVLAVRAAIYTGLRKWELLQIVAQRLVREQPTQPHWRISLAYATRRVNSIPKAMEILLEARGLHPECATIHFNLGCYECQLGDLDGARVHLKRAFEIDPGYRVVALDDPDLEPLWEAINNI